MTHPFLPGNTLTIAYPSGKRSGFVIQNVNDVIVTVRCERTKAQSTISAIDLSYLILSKQIRWNASC